MRIAANEGNVRGVAAPNRHPDGAAYVTAFGLVPKNVNNTNQLNPDSSKKQTVNRFGNFRVKRVSRQMKEMFGMLRLQTRTLIERLLVWRLGSCVKM